MSHILNRTVFIGAALAAFLCGLAFWVRGGEVFIERGAFCVLAAWLALVDERGDIAKEVIRNLEARVTELEDLDQPDWDESEETTEVGDDAG